MNRSEGLITNLGLKSPIAEAFRTFRTNLDFINPDEPLQRILFTSSGPGEGKSTTASNTAISYAQTGKKVLLIDCDLRKPVMHKVWEVSNMQGITNLLVDQSMMVEDVIQKSTVANLDILTCGPIPPNPVELLGSRRMSSLIGEFSKIYDMILFDTPPLISVTDAAVLSAQVDGVILVVAAGKADRGMVQKVKQLLNNVNARILGVVLNRVQIQKNYEHYYYYYTKGEDHAG